MGQELLNHFEILHIKKKGQFNVFITFNYLIELI